jgi:hypothetical protein
MQPVSETFGAAAQEQVGAVTSHAVGASVPVQPVWGLKVMKVLRALL